MLKQQYFPQNTYLCKNKSDAISLVQDMAEGVTKQGDVTYIKQVTPASLKTHLKKLLKQGNLHVGYLTTE